MSVIDVESLVVRYPGAGVDAVRDLSFTVPAGTVHALLGPNGSGKSTTVGVLSTLVAPTGGRVHVAGRDVVRDPVGVRAAIGVTLQETSLDATARARELLVVHGRLHGLSSRGARHRADELLAVVGLAGAADRSVRTYSGGMRRRLDLALSLIHRPAVVFLDEPTTGLDPAARRDLWAEVGRLRDAGTTILLTTQYLEEADQLADRVLILSAGRLVAEGTAEELKRRIGGDVVTLDLDAADRPRARQVMAEQGAVDATPTGLRVSVADAAAALPALLPALAGAGIGVRRVAVARPTLDDVFLELTGAPAAEEAAA